MTSCLLPYLQALTQVLWIPNTGCSEGEHREITPKSVVQEPGVCSGKRGRLVESAALSCASVSAGRSCGWTFAQSGVAVRYSVSVPASLSLC